MPHQLSYFEVSKEKFDYAPTTPQVWMIPVIPNGHPIPQIQETLTRTRENHDHAFDLKKGKADKLFKLSSGFS